MLNIEEHQYSHLLNETNFSNATLGRAKHYYKTNKVVNFQISALSDQIKSYVKGLGEQLYQQVIAIDWDNGKVSGDCSCSLGSNCKHVAAVLLTVDEESLYSESAHNGRLEFLNRAASEKPELATPVFMDWLGTFNKKMAQQKHSKTKTMNTSASKQQNSTKPSDCMVFVLSAEAGDQQSLNVLLCMSRRLKKGGFGKTKSFNPASKAHMKCLNEADLEILASLQIMNEKTFFNFGGEASFRLTGPSSSKVLAGILRTERGFWEDVSLQPLLLLQPQPLNFKWQVLPNAHQIFGVEVNQQPVSLSFLADIWYLTADLAGMGKAETLVPADLLINLLTAPLLPPGSTKVLSNSIQSVVSDESLLPKPLDEPVLVETPQLQPVIRLNLREMNIPLLLSQQITGDPKKFPDWFYHDRTELLEVATAEIYFDYGTHRVPFSRAYVNPSVSYFEHSNAYVFQRDFNSEKSYLLGLKDFMTIVDGSLSPEGSELADILIIPTLYSHEEFELFSCNIIPQLELSGWRVISDDPHFIQVLSDENLSWYAELDETSDYDFFGYSMGIMLDGEKVNILPVIAQLMRSQPIEVFAELSDDERVHLNLPDGKVLSVPFSRIKPILNILVELYDADFKTTDSIKISKRQAALLYEMEQAFKSARMRWFGGDRLRQLGKQLSEFSEIKTAEVPKSFQAQLRQYQQEGVDWLQFLREYQLGGILADDMGLGKTVQTLAHLNIEYAQGRMVYPSLIIAPTSLMFNWQQEAAKFAPDLNVLVFHGDDRHLQSGEFDQYHLILTTYPLLLRDKDLLLKQSFYFLVLDEAQFIKNNKAKSTQVVQQLNASHRLCLTGTPMENHLGEMWSLFNFLMPGFLGNYKQFTQLFRSPIEKHQDADKQKSLVLRTQPFMLRRQKSDVLIDLPEKTEMTRVVELEGPQRDLYESIRLSMEAKVREAIQKQGLARSHIVILDALLKLRQVCCDPQLLSLASAQKAHGHSAKMDLLMEMLPSLVAEKRKVLIFSQFTKMLAIIEEALKKAGLKSVKLTGSTKDRRKPVKAFQEGDVPIFLISLKAGGTGLNLTAADTVIHYDPWWNPAVENQATDRAHRMGQKKSVFVYKFQAGGTVEETIQLMQDKKSQLMEGLFSETKNSKVQFSAADLQSIFKGL